MADRALVVSLVSGVNWRLDAACAGADEWLFFGDEYELPRVRLKRVREAQAICSGCPVRLACHKFAVEHRIRWGIWAGEDRERTRPPVADPPVLCGRGLHLMTPENTKHIKGTDRVRCRECLRATDRLTRQARHARLRQRRREEKEAAA